MKRRITKDKINQKTQRYALRKLSVGIASIAIGSWIQIFMTINVQAQTVDTSTVSESTTTLVETTKIQPKVESTNVHTASTAIPPVITEESNTITTKSDINLISNGDLEKVDTERPQYPDDWRYYKSSSTSEIKQDDGVVSITNNESATTALQRENKINVVENQTYEISYDVKTTNVVSDSFGAYVNIKSYDTNNNLIKPFVDSADTAWRSVSTVGTQDWITHTGIYTAPMNVNNIFLSAELNGSGTAIFDNFRMNPVEIIKDSASDSNVIENGDFSKLDPHDGNVHDGWVENNTEGIKLRSWEANSVTSTSENYKVGVDADGHLVFHSDTPMTTSLKQQAKVDTKANEEYLISYNYKADQLSSGDAKLYIVEKGVTSNPWISLPISGTSGEWKQFKGVYRPSQGVTDIEIRPTFDNAVGTILFDNFSMMKRVIQSEVLSSIDNNNLIKNGHFTNVDLYDGKLDTWRLANDNATQPKYWNEVYFEGTPQPGDVIEVVSNIDANGINNNVLQINRTSDQMSDITQIVDISSLPQNSVIDIQYKVRAESLTGSSMLEIKAYDSNNNNLKYHGYPLFTTTPVTGTSSEWQTVTAKYIPEIGAKTLRVNIRTQNGIGTVMYDDIQLNPRVETIIQEPIFTNVLDMIPNKISLAMDKKYVLPTELVNFGVSIERPSIAGTIDGIISPLSVGNTLVNLIDSNNNIVKTVNLVVEESVENNYDQLRRIRESQVVAKGEPIVSLSDFMIAITNRDYQQSSKASSNNISTSYSEITNLARLITSENSPYFENSSAIRALKDAVEYMYFNAYNPNTNIVQGDWFDYEISAPTQLTNTLVLMYPYFSQEEISRYSEPIKEFIIDPNYLKSTYHPTKAEAADQIRLVRNTLVYSILNEDATLIEDSIIALNTIFGNSEGNGFKEDGSYVYHDDVAYTTGYGFNDIQGLSELFPIINKIDSEELNIDGKVISSLNMNRSVLFTWIQDAFVPLFAKSEIMQSMTDGRTISANNDNLAYGVLDIMLKLANNNTFSDDQNLLLKQQVKTFLTENINSYQNQRPHFNNLLNDSSVSILNRGYSLATYNEMDRVAYYNPMLEFGLGISSYSDKIQNFETINDENLKGWFTGDGMIYLYNGSRNHYHEDYWATIDPYFLPGTTVIDESALPQVDGKGATHGQSAFVGSTQLNEKFGTIAQHLTKLNPTTAEKVLDVQKGWMILDDAIVSIGTNINTMGNSAHTTIENRRIQNGETYNVYVNGMLTKLSQAVKQIENVSTLFLESSDGDVSKNIAYYFFNPTMLNMKQGYESGQWTEINQGNVGGGADNSLKNDEYITIWQNHNSSEDSYAFALLPNVSMTDFNQNRNDLKLLENSKNIQVVFDSVNKVWNVIKYSDEAFILPNARNSEALTLIERGTYVIKENLVTNSQGVTLPEYMISYLKLNDDRSSMVNTADNVSNATLEKDIIYNKSYYYSELINKPNLENQSLVFKLNPIFPIVKTVTESVNTDFNTIYRPNNKLEYQTIVLVVEGKEGSNTKVYKETYQDDQLISRVLISENNIVPIDKVYEVGNKQINISPILFEKEIQYNHDLLVGVENIIQSGKNGSERTEIIYEVDPITGRLINPQTTTIMIEEPVSEIIEIGVKLAEDPIDPTDPVKPEEPTDPTDPVKPEEPTNPIDPGKPEEPTDPTDPVKLEEPTDPTDPGKPEEPTDPTDPVKPEEPTDPTDPVKPEEPTDPTDPVKPEEPTNPTDPVKPEEPTDPTDPVKPEEPTNPTDPVKPEEPTNPIDPSKTEELLNPNRTTIKNSSDSSKFKVSKSSLPITGENDNQLALTIMSLSLLGIGFAVITRDLKKKINKANN